ncbi:GNAT family N-acetyltransferase [Christiangramia sp. SM2212]|uniref:GNAT family N-acetyltransferase n=1 Tax=Christiangramia sediminicola TaxID=3073267 RepID=A0ABU1EMZ4_9FLAO|nr:GNAT family N-acetyltransferase [Christiangramia sp. SM2212]MDR5589758.1 GNAT family N-acetyltransferase [Christiangramia sp. SM2212]
MLTLKGQKVFLRALEPEDLDFVHEIENNEDFWEISSTQSPYSKFLIRQYIENAHRDIYDIKQLRLVICTKRGRRVGLIDVFDLEPRDKRASLGILIANKKDRNKGFGSESLSLICDFCFTHLGLHQVYANVTEGNKDSMRVFENNGFRKVGLKKDWTLFNGEYKDEWLYQLISNVH